MYLRTALSTYLRTDVDDTVKRIGIIKQKGGVGATTLTANIGTTLHQRGYETLLVDADPQGSLRDWSAQTEDGPAVVGVDRPVVHEQLPKISDFEIAIMDGAPRMEQMTISIIKASDLVLLPVQPSSVDLWSVGTIIDHVEARQQTAQLQARFVLSRAPVTSTLTSDTRAALNDAPFEQTSTTVHQRVAYARTLGRGESVLESRNDKAQAEINALTNEIKQLLSL